jgi:hypothetical protein
MMKKLRNSKVKTGPEEAPLIRAMMTAVARKRKKRARANSGLEFWGYFNVLGGPPLEILRKTI